MGEITVGKGGKEEGRGKKQDRGRAAWMGVTNCG